MEPSQSHPCLIVGLGFRGRDTYIAHHVEIGDLVDLRLEADNPHDPLTVAAYHAGHHIGYVAPGWRWVAHSLAQGDRHEVVVSAFKTDAQDRLSALAIDITVLKDQAKKGPSLPASSSPPLPGTAPWAPDIVHAPLPRWPVIIPLGLLAGLAAAAWFLMERGFLPHIAQFAGAP